MKITIKKAIYFEPEIVKKIKNLNSKRVNELVLKGLKQEELDAYDLYSKELELISNEKMKDQNAETLFLSQYLFDSKNKSDDWWK